MLRTRVLVAVVALPILIAIILVGGWLFHIAVMILLGLGVRELLHLGQAEGHRPSFAVALFLLLAILLAARYPDVLGPGVAAGIMLAMVASLRAFQQGDKTPLNGFTITLVGALLPGWLGSHLVLLRFLPDGEWWLLTVLFATFSVDSGAYFVGRPLGKHKMAPKISPKKSWEGFAGGIVFGIVFGALFAALFGRNAPDLLPWHGAVLGLLIALISPIGDLAISAFKRQANVKDSSKLIPGHGGALDRLDTVLISAVLGYYFIRWFV
jgi:phosphatidate cytidylyltransferase